MARKKQTPPQINTVSVQVIKKFTGQINDKKYVFDTNQIVEMTKGELQVFEPYVKRI